MKSVKPLRGRRGIWVPGNAAMPPMMNVGYQRVPEETEGVNLMKRVMVQPPSLRDLMLRMYHVPNGGTRGGREGAMFKAQGVRSGVPDYVLPLPRGGYHGLYMELKRTDGLLRPEQQAELERLHADGYRAVCVWTGDTAFAELFRYVQS